MLLSKSVHRYNFVLFVVFEANDQLDRAALKDARSNEMETVCKELREQLSDVRSRSADLSLRMEALLLEKEDLRKVGLCPHVIVHLKGQYKNRCFLLSSDVCFHPKNPTECFWLATSSEGHFSRCFSNLVQCDICSWRSPFIGKP